MSDLPNDVFSNLTPTMDAARGAIARVGLRLYRAFLVIETFSGDEVGEGDVERAFEEILPTPRVRHLSAARIASSGGAYRDGALELSKITRRMTLQKLLGQREQSDLVVPGFLDDPMGGATGGQVQPGVGAVGDSLPQNQRLFYGLLPRGQPLLELYKLVGQPVLFPLHWSLTVNPVNRRVPSPSSEP